MSASEDLIRRAAKFARSHPRYGHCDDPVTKGLGVQLAEDLDALADRLAVPPGRGREAGRYRVGRSLGTTIYDDHAPVPEDQVQQPVAWVPGDPNLAYCIALLLDIHEARLWQEEAERS